MVRSSSETQRSNPNRRDRSAKTCYGSVPPATRRTARCARFSSVQATQPRTVSYVRLGCKHEGSRSCQSFFNRNEAASSRGGSLREEDTTSTGTASEPAEDVWRIGQPPLIATTPGRPMTLLLCYIGFLCQDRLGHNREARRKVCAECLAMLSLAFRRAEILHCRR